MVLFGAVIVAMALVLAACGGDDDGGDDGDDQPTATEQSGGGATATREAQATAEATEDSGDRLADPCSLVTPAEISEIAGEEYGDGELNSDDCTYNSPTNRTVTVSVEEHVGQAESVFENTVESFDLDETENIGERAAWNDQFGELDVLVDSDRLLIVSVPFILADDKESAAIAIAQKALD